MDPNSAESQSKELTLETAYAAELFSKLLAAAQDETIDVIRSLLSHE
jgi:hypothetical protein